MKRWVSRLVILGLAVAAGLWAWRAWFPGPEHAIRRNLSELAKAACIPANEKPFDKLNNALRVAKFFSDDVEITASGLRGSWHISGREELRQASLSARQALSSLNVEFLDVSVAVAPDRKSATVHLTAKADVPGDSVPEAAEMQADFRKTDGKWLIRRVETVKTLR